ncbi:MAG: nitrate transporter substrate-binding protein [Pseudonocardia sp.]|jgi:hypothetical protein|nr:nitrate transporter substrate-binding protein [Pseudonocardia sp.]
MSAARLRALASTALALSTLAALTACGGTTSTATTAAALTIGPTDLSGVCPGKVTIQTDWNPEAEQGDLYQLLGPNPTIDAAHKRVSGPLFSKGSYTGVNVEVRAGGPAIGFQTVTSQLYTDPNITLGYANTDEAVQLSATMPTTAVFAPFEKGPQMIMWDPATYPDVHSIADLGKTGATVRYFDGAAYMEYLTGSGILSKTQVDGSYDGTPANYVAAGGKDAQQGFASVEPYVYSHQLPAWNKPVGYQLIHDTGYPVYASAISARTADLDKLSPCLQKLVPVLQQATVDFYRNPGPTNDLIVNAVNQFDTGWIYPAEVAAYSVDTQLKLGLVSNGTNATLGDFDRDRIARIIGITTPIFTRLGTPPAAGLTPDQLFTNKFIDPSIGM